MSATVSLEEFVTDEWYPGFKSGFEHAAKKRSSRRAPHSRAPNSKPSMPVSIQSGTRIAPSGTMNIIF